MPAFNASMGAFENACATVRLDWLVEDVEDALAGCNPPLYTGVDVAQLPEWFGDETRSGDIGEKLTGRNATAQFRIESQPEQPRNRCKGQELYYGRTDLIDPGELEILLQCIAAAFTEALILIVHTAKASHHGKSANRFGCDLGNAAHGCLYPTAVLLELPGGKANDQGDEGCDGEEQQGQFPVQVKNIGHESHHGQPLTNHHLDGVGGGRGDLFHIISNDGDQLTGIVLAEKAARHQIDMPKQIHPQLIDNAARDVGDVIAA